ncbi:MAG: TonB-dependent receptor [Cyanobacteria bacterium J06573_11]
MRFITRFGLSLLASAVGIFSLDVSAFAASNSSEKSIQDSDSSVSRTVERESHAVEDASHILLSDVEEVRATQLLDLLVSEQALEFDVAESDVAESNAVVNASESLLGQTSETATPVQTSETATPVQASETATPVLAQSLDELLEAEEPVQVINPPNPVGSQIRNDERVQGEIEGEIDEVILRQVPDQMLLENIYSIEVSPVNGSELAADRRSTIQLTGRVIDEQGELINHDVVVTLTTSAGEFIGADYDIDRVGHQVLARWGEFDAELRSNLDAQRVVIRASAARDDLLAQAPMPLEADLVSGAREIEAYTDVNFITPLRPSLAAGVIDLRFGNAATNFGGSFRDFLAPGSIGQTELDVGASGFATGAIGDWLFTGAVNTRRNLNERCDGGTRFYQNTQSQFCAYEIYGDSSTNDYLTPSLDSVYLRFQQDASVLDADPNYFMWGDYSTNEFSRPSQLFSATSRQLHGFIGNYTLASGEDSGLQLTAMYANNIRPFRRDTIVPDGTSGYYFLSDSLLLPGSEEIFIEVEELNRPGTVVERVALSRGADYRIDYDRGAILFNQPVAITDANPFGPPLVRRIVATYQVDSQTSGGDLYGGRLQYNFSYDLESPSWIGASVVTEDADARDYTLYGIDGLLSFGDSGRLIAEYAQSSLSGTPGNNANGSAYRIEASSEFTDNLYGRAYWRSADSGFSNTATSSFRPGQTRYGAELAALLGQDTQIEFQFDQEDNRGTAPGVITGFDALRNLRTPGAFAPPGTPVDNSLTTLRAGLQQQFGDITFDLGYVYRDRTDRRLGAQDFNSSQLVSGLTLPLASNLTFRAQNELNIGGSTDPIYPGRTVLGLDWQVLPEVTVRVAQQFFSDSDVAPDSITSVDTLLDYDLSDNTQLTGRYSVLGGFNGVTGQGALGLNHRWNISPGLNVDLGYERVIGEGLGLIGTGERFVQPFAIGQSASALGIVPGSTYSIGLEYLDNSSFQASARAEYRDGQGGNDNTVLTASLAGKLSPSLTALGRFEYANYANQYNFVNNTFASRLGNTSSFKLGLAYRNPNSDTFNGLLSYEFATNPSITLNTPGSDTITEHTLSAEGIYAPGPRWEFYGKYGLRSSNANLSSLGLSSVSNTIHLAQLRAAYRLGYRWDIVGEARYIAQPSTNYYESALALETGYYVTPDLRLGVGYSFGAADDRSFQNSYRDDGGFYLAATFKVNELFNGFGLQDVAPAQQTEALVERDEEIAVDDVCPEGVDPRGGGVDPCENREIGETIFIQPSESDIRPALPAISEPGDDADNDAGAVQTAPPEADSDAGAVQTSPSEPIRGLW